MRTLRTKYADSVPGNLRSEDLKYGMSEKIDAIPYKSYLQDPNSDNYQIDWTKIEVNPDKLLSYLGLKRIEEKAAAIEPIEEKEKTTTGHEKKSDNSMLWIGLTLAVLIISIFTYFKAKKK